MCKRSRGSSRNGLQKKLSNLQIRRVGYLCLALVLFASLAEIRWMGAAGIGIMVLGMGQTVLFCKCPYCGSNFNIQRKLPKFCPTCGKRLED